MLTRLLAKSLGSQLKHTVAAARVVVAAQRESLVVGLKSVPPLPSGTGAAIHAVIILPAKKGAKEHSFYC